MKTADIIASLHEAQAADRQDRAHHQAVLDALDNCINAAQVAVTTLERKPKLAWKPCPSTKPPADFMPDGCVYLLRVTDQRGVQLVRAARWHGEFIRVPPTMSDARYAILRT